VEASGLIVRTASAGSLESSDCLVTVTPSESIEIDYSGANAKLFTSRAKRLTAEILKKYSISGASVHIHDQGAIEAAMRARVETALERAMEAEEDEG
jgi:citrate lyase subunit gamma (acyl carrier protein)